jgi:hypothetical protein
MFARFLAWLTSGVLALASLLMLLVSAAPGAEARFAALHATLTAAALFFALIGMVLTGLPRDHWGNRSFAARCLLSLAAVSS